jgi:hypothetical protein
LASDTEEADSLKACPFRTSQKIKTGTLSVGKPEKYPLTGLVKWRKPSVNTMMKAKQNWISCEVNKSIIGEKGNPSPERAAWVNSFRNILLLL